MRTIWIDTQGGKHYSKPTKLDADGRTYAPPTDEQLTANGWHTEQIIDPMPTPYVPTYSELVEQYIREHGFPTYGSELAVLNNYAENKTEYADTYDAYMKVRKDAKVWAKTQPHRAEEGE